MIRNSKLLAYLQEPNAEWVLSYKLIRLAIGWLGIALPLLCFIATRVISHCHDYQYSISAYYYTFMRSYFTGTICAVSLFLFAYRGPQRMDTWLGNLGCIFGLGIVFFPTGVPEKIEITRCTLTEGDPGTPVTSVLHYISAGLFFSSLVVFTLFMFTKTHKDRKMKPEKSKRNKVFRICGVLIIICLLLISVNTIDTVHDWWIGLHPVFWLESTALWAFGISWLTKAELLFGDKNH